MADRVREIERKYEATEGGLPDLTAAAGVADVVDRGVASLDATYHDTGTERLAADGITLRRRTGGGDAGWHLKLPLAEDTREEIRAPLTDRLPRELAALVRSRVRRAPLVPVMRLRSERELRQLLDADGRLLAEVSVDAVSAERPTGDGAGPTAHWTEIEVELAEGADPAVLDAVERQLRKAGIRRAPGPSKLARALAETRPGPRQKAKPAEPAKTGKKARTAKTAKPAKPSEKPKKRVATAGDQILDYVRAQAAALVELDPAVRRELPDSVHRMRVATRRLRSAFRSFGKVLDRAATDPIADELKWLAAELGLDRDREVLTARLYERLGELPKPLLIGPVRGRLRTWSGTRRRGARRHVTAVLDSDRYLDLLDSLDALLADPPLRPAAARPPLEVVPGAVLRDFDRLEARMRAALAAPVGPERDLAMHEARKAAKRARYSAETARPAIGKPARRFVRHMKALQDVLGDHQDSVVAREALRELALQAQAAGESGFTFGVLYGHEEARATTRESELAGAWAEAADPRRRAGLRA
ncbi:CYTH and CHAD domain-containing protein [Streptomyces pathocidini]|uniref:CYTH and CHAD domain-containing protein n=1 Tax=Streptomyces pathocidini TaxID=1650571 RepID=UPI0033CEE817